jgi:phosphate starvation-inducible protein PhoH
MVKTPNTEKRVPKGEITYKLQLTEEQKEVKRNSFNYKVNVITGDAGTSKTFVACQIALDALFKKVQFAIDSGTPVNLEIL